MTELTRDQFVSGFMRQYGVPSADAERAADRKFGKAKSATPTPIENTSSLRIVAEQTDLARSVQIKARRSGDALWMEIGAVPRTKKNSAETLGSSKSKPYKRYLAELLEAIAEVRDVLLLPLPDRRPLGYNLCAHFHVDLRGEAADRPGLEQGLNDALQEAGVVANDWLFRQADGTRVILGSPRPRVALWITPILSVSLDTPEIP